MFCSNAILCVQMLIIFYFTNYFLNISLQKKPIDPRADILAGILPSDTTSQHKNHLFDFNCKICTGKTKHHKEETTSKSAHDDASSHTEEQTSSVTTPDKAETKLTEHVKDHSTVKDTEKIAKPSKDTSVVVDYPKPASQGHVTRPPHAQPAYSARRDPRLKDAKKEGFDFYVQRSADQDNQRYLML